MEEPVEVYFYHINFKNSVGVLTDFFVTISETTYSIRNSYPSNICCSHELKEYISFGLGKKFILWNLNAPDLE